ncbi:hypothetical protein FA13DRAFT_1742738 [Coprinellus micaceus]|uniref:F-box domain-containing protein n=1 Tax=Coprinellus micaceus TaxID=71717 RepID=A0A4Y7SHH9_COPMI|nr:hypothetical protein FA13DRAFT_1742738 [Coprinellus micaceus]
MDSNHPPAVTPMERSWGEIFASVIAVGLKKQWMNREERDQLIRLTLVCKWWREIALLTRYFWGGIELHRWFLPTEPFQIPSKKSEMSLAITSGRVTLGPRCPRHPESNVDPESVDETCWLHHILAFLKAGPPLYGLRIDGQSTVCLRALMRGLQDSSSPSWSSIQYLDWRIWDREYYDMGNPNRTFTPFTPALATLPPSLSSLELSISLLSDCHSQVTQMIAPATLHRLKSLNINSIKDLSPMVSLLERCVNLQHLSISQSGDNGYGGVLEILDMDKQLLCGRNPIMFPHLQSLQLDLQPPRDVLSFLGVLRAPDLKIVRTRQERNTQPEERYLWNSLRALHLLTPGEDQPAVQHLTLFARSIPPAKVQADELHDILSDLPPSLRHLRLENLTFDAAEFVAHRKAQATATAALNGLLPSLQCLEIVDPGSKFDLSAFLELVKGGGRGKPHLGAFAALRRIVFAFSLRDQWEYKDRSFLDQYRDEATLRELETSFGIVMDLITITTWK